MRLHAFNLHWPILLIRFLSLLLNSLVSLLIWIKLRNWILSGLGIRPLIVLLRLLHRECTCSAAYQMRVSLNLLARIKFRMNHVRNVAFFVKFWVVLIRWHLLNNSLFGVITFRWLIATYHHNLLAIDWRVMAIWLVIHSVQSFNLSLLIALLSSLQIVLLLIYVPLLNRLEPVAVGHQHWRWLRVLCRSKRLSIVIRHVATKLSLVNHFLLIQTLLHGIAEVLYVWIRILTIFRLTVLRIQAILRVWACWHLVEI